MHISIYPIFHRATSHLYVHVIVSACWFDHVMFTWGSRRYWCEIPFFRLFLKFVFHRVNSKNLGEKYLEINHLEMIRKKKVCKLSFYFNHRLRYFLVVIYVTVLILYITMYVMISGLHQVFMQSKKIFSIPSRLVVALKFIILTNGLFLINFSLFVCNFLYHTKQLILVPSQITATLCVISWLLQWTNSLILRLLKAMVGWAILFIDVEKNPGIATGLLYFALWFV